MNQNKKIRIVFDIDFDELLKMDDPLAGPLKGRPSLGEVMGKTKKASKEKKDEPSAD